MPPINENLINAADAQAHFGDLLDRVRSGEEITITERGLPVARIVPIRPAPPAHSRRLAIEAMRELASRNRLATVARQMKAEGRR